MHGLINRSIECFLRDTCADDVWPRVSSRVGVGSFEALLHYEDDVTAVLIDIAADVIGRDRGVMLEDLGTYIASHPRQERVRRLLRFGGSTFREFVLSLDDLRDRARLALDDFDLPQIETLQNGSSEFSVFCRPVFVGVGHVLAGVIRTMSDDYGTLSVVEYDGVRDHMEQVGVHLLDAAHAPGRAFSLHLANT